MLKNRRYPQKSMFTATGGPTDLPLVVLGGSNMQHTAVNLVTFWAPSNSWNFIQQSLRSFRSVLLSL